MMRQNNEFGVWLAAAMQKHGLTSTRQVTIRTDVSHTTLEDALRGRQPSVETTIKVAMGFGEDIGRVLQLAGHTEIAKAWSEGAAPLSETMQELSENPRLKPQVLKWLSGIPPQSNDRKAAEQLLRSLYEKYNKEDEEE